MAIRNDRPESASRPRSSSVIRESGSRGGASGEARLERLLASAGAVGWDRAEDEQRIRAAAGHGPGGGGDTHPGAATRAAAERDSRREGKERRRRRLSGPRATRAQGRRRGRGGHGPRARRGRGGQQGAPAGPGGASRRAERLEGAHRAPSGAADRAPRARRRGPSAKEQRLRAPPGAALRAPGTALQRPADDSSAGRRTLRAGARAALRARASTRSASAGAEQRAVQPNPDRQERIEERAERRGERQQERLAPARRPAPTRGIEGERVEGQNGGRPRTKPPQSPAAEVPAADRRRLPRSRPRLQEAPCPGRWAHLGHPSGPVIRIPRRPRLGTPPSGRRPRGPPASSRLLRGRGPGPGEEPPPGTGLPMPDIGGMPHSARPAPTSPRRHPSAAPPGPPGDVSLGARFGRRFRARRGRAVCAGGRPGPAAPGGAARPAAASRAPDGAGATEGSDRARARRTEPRAAIEPGARAETRAGP